MSDPPAPDHPTVRRPVVGSGRNGACGRFEAVLSRRDLLARSANGFGLLALAGMLAEQSSPPPSARAAEPAGTPDPAAELRSLAARDPLAPRKPHHPARAKRVLFLFMHGGPSQVDTFDPKPLLARDNGKPFPGKRPRVTFAATGNLLASPWAFRRHGKSGLEVSELFPKVAAHADDLCVVRSIHADNSAHGGALLQLHTGSDTFVRPSIGSWVTYGLGTENRNLPGFLTICPNLGHGGVQNWSSAFLPADYQGTALGHAGIKARDAAISFLRDEGAKVWAGSAARSGKGADKADAGAAPSPETVAALQTRRLELLRTLNAGHRDARGPDSALDGRINALELAYRMQAEVPAVMDLAGESRATLDLYGIGPEATDNFGRQCLMARRFLERGVRFVQVSHSYKWDQHGNLKKDHTRNALEVDGPIAGLLTDLKARGLLEDTLVWWGGEFGRTPTAQGGDGRDHNPHGFSMWFAGAGVKGGHVHGATDDYGWYAVQDKVHMHDVHATILHLLGMDHERLTYRFAGRDFRLTDVAGRVVKEILS